MPLHPQAETFLTELAALDAPAPYELSPAEARAQMAAMPQQREPIGNVQDRSIPGSSGSIPIRIYEPATIATSGGSTSSHPAIVYFHGGGWVLGDLDSHDAVCRALANASNSIVVAVDYRLAPEHRFPAAVEDAYAATIWIWSHASELRVDRERISVSGDSAGGNLAAAVTLIARENGNLSLFRQVLLYPITDCNLDTPSYRAFGDGYFLTKQLMAWFWDQYAEDSDGRFHPHASPVRAKSLQGLPPALVLTAEFDPLRDEGDAYARRLKASGVPVESVCVDGMIHGFMRRIDLFDTAKETMNKIGQYLKKAHRTAS
jgi:acetyl esterase